MSEESVFSFWEPVYVAAVSAMDSHITIRAEILEPGL